MTVAVLERELARAGAAEPVQHAVLALAGTDPLRLDLPAMPAPHVSPEALRTLSALYLAARLEETGLLVALDALVEQRAILRVPPATAARIEDVARRRQRFLAPEQRRVLYARCVGAAGGPDSGPGARCAPLLAALCSALVVCGPRPAGAQDVPRQRVELAARDLAVLAGTVVGGGAALAVAPLNEQLRAAIEVVGDPGVGALVGRRGTWETLRALLGAHAPDLRRLIDSARHGQRVLLWCSTAAGSAAAAIDADAVTSAAAWLAACGLGVRGEGSI